MTKIIHVAVGILLNQSNEVLIAKRSAAQHQGGLWEFPGGKVEPGETTLHALIREFKEEVAVHIQDATPLMKINHDYGDKTVLLDVWLSRTFTGTVKGMEGQQIQWLQPSELKHYSFPKANAPIIEKLLMMD